MSLKTEPRKQASQGTLAERTTDPAEQGDLRLAKKYWLETIRPYIQHRRLRDAELYVAVHAYDRLRRAAGCATRWNESRAGRRSPIPQEDFPDFSKMEFHEPEALSRNDLKAEVLAAIAAPLIKNHGNLNAVEAAHDLLMAAEQYIEMLPKKEQASGSVINDLDLEFRDVTFAEIMRSNKDSANGLPRLPLLPPEPATRNSGNLTKQAVRAAVNRFFVEHKKQFVPQQQWNRENEQEAELLSKGELRRFGSDKQSSYEEHKETEGERFKEGRIRLYDLCELRWQRFREFRVGQVKRGITQRGKPKSVKPKPRQNKSSTKIPRSAASTQVFAGKGEKSKSAPLG